MLAILLPAVAFAGGVNVSPDALYTDHVTLKTADGAPLDVDGDGNTDLAVASNLAGAGDRSRYYPGNGDGTFGTPVLLTAGESSEIVATDLNGDMFIDLVQGRRDATMVFHLGDGAGGVNTPGTAVSADTDRVLAVAAGDLDLDGDIDLVTGTGHAGGLSANPLQPNRFYLNNFIDDGTVTFTSNVITEAVEDDTRSVALADMDADGDLDIIVGNDETTPGSNLVYLNQLMESGTMTLSFAAGIDFGPPNDQTSRILIGDLNDDGQPDVVTLNNEQAGLSPGINRFFLNDTNMAGTFTLIATGDVSADTDRSHGGILADFDGDGDLDLAVANALPQGGILGQTARNRLYLNQFEQSGTVSFVAASDISTDEHQSRDLAAADLNDDGHIDIVVGNQAFGGESAIDRRYLNNGTADPFLNQVPVIDGQARALQTAVDTDLTIVLDDDVTVTDPDNVFPVDFTLIVQAGTNYSFTDNTITPDPGFEGQLAVPVVVNDGSDDSAAFELCVTVGSGPVCNNAPSFTSTPVTAVTEGEAYTYDVTASDPDAGATLAITAPTLPAWLTLTDNGDGTATLTGTPAAGDVGDHAVSLQVSDGADTAVQDFTVTVSAAPAGNGPPVFDSTAVTAATEDEAYTYDVTTSDPDDDTLTITAPTLPAWLTLTDNGDGTATLTGTPAAGDVGNHDVSLQVSDGTDTAVQDFSIAVDAAAPPPPPPSGGGGGGGGALGFLSLLALLTFGANRMRRRNP